MMLKTTFAAAALVAMAAAAPAVASTADVVLSGYIQAGHITNNGAAAITSIVYSLGTAEDNLGTWQIETAGGVASDFLSDPQYFQTVTWSGLNILSGSSFDFGYLDIDLIQTLSPLSVTGAELGDASTLRNAFVSIFWNDGSSGTANLVQQAWASDQTLHIESAVAPVPVPAALPLLLGALGGLGLVARRRKA